MFLHPKQIFHKKKFLPMIRPRPTTQLPRINPDQENLLLTENHSKESSCNSSSSFTINSFDKGSKES